jgi:hypothetical protein
VPREPAAVASGEDPGTLAESVGDGLRRKGPDQRGGQLEGERDAIGPAAYLSDRPGISGSEREVWPGASSPVQKETHRVELGEGRPRWEGQGGHSPRRLPFDPDRFPTGGDHRDVGAAGKQRRAQLGTCVQNVLAVVHDEDGVTGTEVFDDSLPCRATGRLTDTDHMGDPRGDQDGIDDRRQVYPPDAVSEVALEVPCHLEC